MKITTVSLIMPSVDDFVAFPPPPSPEPESRWTWLWRLTLQIKVTADILWFVLYLLSYERVTVSFDDCIHGVYTLKHRVFYERECVFKVDIPPSLFSLSGRPLVLIVGPVLLVVVATVIPLHQGPKVTPAAQATVHHLDEDASAHTQDPIPGPDLGPIPVPDAIGSTHDRGAVPTLPMVGRSMAEVGTEADLRCPTGGGTRETE